MYAQHVRKWSLKTQRMPLISLVIYVSNMLLLITCAPATTTAVAAAAAATITKSSTTIATTTREQQNPQRLGFGLRLGGLENWRTIDIGGSGGGGSGSNIAAAKTEPKVKKNVEDTEETYYIPVVGEVVEVKENEKDINNNNYNNNGKPPLPPPRPTILSRLLSEPSNSLSSNSNIKLTPATVFAPAVAAAAAAAAQPSIQNTNTVPNTLINSQIINLLYNGGTPLITTTTTTTNTTNTSNSNSNKARRHAIATSTTTTAQQHNHQLSTARIKAESELHRVAGATPSAVAAAAASNYSRGIRPAQFYVIESYEVPDTLPMSSGDSSSATTTTTTTNTILTQAQRMLLQQAARNRRDYSTSSDSSSSSGQQQQQQQQFQQLQQQHRATQQRQQQQHQHHQSHKPHQRGGGGGGGGGGGKRRNRNRNRNQNQNQKRRPQRRGKKRAGRYCSARDPGQLAFEAPTVFAGKIISMTPDRSVNFSATLEVKQVYKQQVGYRMPDYVRLQFALRNNSGECDIYRERLLPRGLVRGDDLELGVTYMTFVQQNQDLGNFTILGQPIRNTHQVVDAVRLAVSENYAQLASITSITASNSTMEEGKELHITCKVEGQPPPKVTWFKDDKSINRKRNLYQFKHHKRRSELIIRSFNSSDAGIYECRAKNKVSKKIERRLIRIKAYPVARPDSTRSNGLPCPDNFDFCLNGGTCELMQELRLYYCNCPDGFIGERCEGNANSVPDSRYSNNPECGDSNYFGSYYC